MHSLTTMKHLHNELEAQRILARPETQALHAAQEQKFQRDVDEAKAQRETPATV